MAFLQDGDNIFLTGLGSSPTGDHPFLDRFNLATLKAEHLFRCDDDHYEVVEGLLDAKGDKFLTRREGPKLGPSEASTIISLGIPGVLRPPRSDRRRNGRGVPAFKVARLKQSRKG